MAMIDINFNPPRGALRQFALLFLIFAGIAGALAWFRPGALTTPAIIVGTSTLIALFIHFRVKEFLTFTAGAAVWAAAVAAVVFVDLGVEPRLALTGVVGGGLLLVGLASLALPAFARIVYVGMICAVFPIGTVLSYLLMGVVLYGVLTPIGLIMRAVGKDPMQRKLDPAASSYWHAREPVTEMKRYFKQF